MSSDPRDAGKRVPKSLDEGTALINRYTITDLLVVALPAVGVVLTMQLFVPPDASVAGYRVRRFVLPLGVVGALLGAVGVYLTPDHRGTDEWLATMLAYRRRPAQQSHATAREYTQVERVLPDADAIERADGAFVGLVRVEPPSMALATDTEWREQAAAFQDFLNTTVDFPIQLYATTQPFDADAYLAHFEDRLEDPDVRETPQLEALINDYVDWYAADLKRRQATIRDHYVVVTVRPREVRFEDESIVQKLTRLPIVGVFLQVWVAPRVEEEQAAMRDTLDERLRLVARGLREIDGVSTSRVSAADATERIAEFWRGEAVTIDDPEQVLGTSPVVRSSAHAASDGADATTGDATADAVAGQNAADAASDGTTEGHDDGDDESATDPGGDGSEEVVERGPA